MTVNKQIISKQRIADHGEVFTAPREVNAMLDMVATETARIESRFLEPACGKGAFLTEILRRKLAVVHNRYQRSRSEYERYMFLAVSSLYGIDIQADNVADCRTLLLGICTDAWVATFKCGCMDAAFIESLRFVLSRNIICGDALSLKDADGQPIVFSEWSAVRGNMFKRRDFYFSNLVDTGFTNGGQYYQTDTGDGAWFPVPVREYPLTDYKRLKDANEQL